QWFEDHRVDEREERGRGRHAEAEEERHRQRESWRAHERTNRPREIVARSHDQEVPHQRDPRRRDCASAARAGGVEQQLRVFLDRTLLVRIAAAQQPEQPAVDANHARAVLRRARLARAWPTIASRRRISALSTRLPSGVSAKYRRRSSSSLGRLSDSAIRSSSSSSRSVPYIAAGQTRTWLSVRAATSCMMP